MRGTTRRGEEIRNLYGFRIWFEAPHDVRLERGVARGNEDTEKWLKEWNAASATPTLASLLRLAEALNVPLSDLALCAEEAGERGSS